jgi:hypothetical protein
MAATLEASVVVPTA